MKELTDIKKLTDDFLNDMHDTVKKYKTLKEVIKEEEEGYLSCCGDILDPDFPICPICLEHC